jgi:hypothetical protein
MQNRRRTHRCRVESLDIDNGLIPRPAEAEEPAIEAPKYERPVPVMRDARGRRFRMEAQPASESIRSLLREIGSTYDPTVSQLRTWIRHADESVHLKVLERHRRVSDPAVWEFSGFRDMLVTHAFVAAHEEGVWWTPLLEQLVSRCANERWLRPWTRQIVYLRQWISCATDVEGLQLLKGSSLRGIREPAIARLFVLDPDSESLWRMSSWGRALGRILRSAFRPSQRTAASATHIEVAGDCVARALRQQAMMLQTRRSAHASVGVTRRQPWDLDGARVDPTPWAAVNEAARRYLDAAAADPRAYAHEGAIAAFRRWGMAAPSLKAQATPPPDPVDF